MIWSLVISAILNTGHNVKTKWNAFCERHLIGHVQNHEDEAREEDERRLREMGIRTDEDDGNK